jgi:CRP-like cAMP-binding protein
MSKNMSVGVSGNRLLDLLPAPEFQRLRPLLHKMDLASGQVLYEPWQAIEQFYFPISAVLSAVVVMQNGDAIEVGTVGNEGVSGLPALAVVTTSPHRVFAQIAGEVWRIDAARLNHELRELSGLKRVMTSYQQAFIYQMSQGVACNGLHPIIQRCCRWLLMTHDRVPGDEVALTHEFLSFMLGVRRSSVTEVLQSLQQQGHIRYRQGNITIVNREGLELLSCECYPLVRKEYQHLLGV